MTTDCQTHRLTFCPFDEGFLEKSWRWLQDPEIQRLTMTPSFNREQQRRWFESLPQMKDYSLWGMRCDEAPIGALGLKHIDHGRAEYWGYIGERAYWGLGLGGEMMRFVFGEAGKMRLRADASRWMAAGLGRLLPKGVLRER